ncbi:MAG TPA: Grx4 family monothiol glutaredoxin [Steroidobacteraceae bacterium]|nr:Grx4 family monothiol glutaredoxin [Steroidobacteraceae bacterium]
MTEAPVRATPPERPPSPCINVCSLDSRGYCIGCLRTGAEIGRWLAMSSEEQWRLIAELEKRRRQLEVVTMDVVERIKSELAAGPVVLFMKGTPDFPQCGFSAQTVAALRAVGANFRYVNIFEEPEIREALKRYSNWPTYPQLYVKGELIGGCDIALEMLKSGELKKLMSEAGAAQ